jgi:signal transduction histidine kinase
MFNQTTPLVREREATSAKSNWGSATASWAPARTPVKGVMCTTGLALDTELTAERSEYLAIVESPAGALLQIVNDTLDFSKIEAGYMRLESVGFPLDDTLHNTIRSPAIHGHQKNLEMLLNGAPGVPDRLPGDPGRQRRASTATQGSG